METNEHIRDEHANRYSLARYNVKDENCTVAHEAFKKAWDICYSYSHWQPIETAPKDGRAILIYHNGTIRQARWDDGFNWEVDEIHEDAYTKDATHWQPLPKPPAS